MQTLIYAFFISVFLLPYLNRLGLVPRQATWLPEILSLIVLSLVVLQVVRKKEFSVGLAYISIFLLFILTIIFGIVLNSVPAGPIFAGLRDYLKFMPLFFLPAMYPVSQVQLRNQLLFLLSLALLQLPVSLYQRLFQFAGLVTGDVVMGTLTGSGNLTVFLLAAVSLLTGLYLKKRVKGLLFLALLAAMFVPTTINETKVTVFLLPVALLAPVLFIEGGLERMKRMSGVFLLGAALFVVFVPVYNSFFKERRNEGIVDFFTTQGRLEEYLERTGRMKSPFVLWSVDPTKFMLGLGIGNASESFLGDKYSGVYYRKYGDLIHTTVLQWLFEIGLIGTVLIMSLFVFVLRDALYLRSGNEFASAFALGWIGVLAVLSVSLIYNRAVANDAIGCPLWYYSGYIAATAMRKRLKLETHGADKR